MSNRSEDRKMRSVIELATQLDIATNPDPRAVFQACRSGFQVWCTPEDHPQGEGWNNIQMTAGAFCKACEFLGMVIWKWEEDRIIGISLETSAYALSDQKSHRYSGERNIPEGAARRTIFNRSEDIEWLKEKVTWLFAEAGIPLLPFEYEEPAAPDPGPHLLAYYRSEEDEYMVLISPDTSPEEFCKPGYSLRELLEVWNEGEIPADVILRPEPARSEADTEPDEGPLVEAYENASRLHDDDWLESKIEDDISGWEE